MTVVVLGPKPFQELVFKAVKNRKRSGQWIASRSDRLTEICFSANSSKATLYETMMTTVDEVNKDKTKVPD